MKKELVGIIICLLFASTIFGQSDQVLFNAEIQSANVDLQDQQYRSAIKHSEKAKTYLGQDSTTAQIEYIITKSNIGLGYFDDAKSSLKRYFNTAKESDQDYKEMLLLLSRIDDIKEETQKAEEARKVKDKEEMDAWDRAVKINTAESYQSFSMRFPQSKHTVEANKLANNMKIESQLQIEKIVLAEYKTKWKGRKTAKGILLGGGVATMLLSLRALDHFCLCLDITEVSYDPFTGAPIDKGTPIPFLLGAGATTTGLLFIHPRKYKKRYQKQLEVVNNLEKGLLTDSSRLSPHWQIGMSAQRPGVTLSFNF